MANTLVDGTRLSQALQRTKAYIDMKTSASSSGGGTVALTKPEYAALAEKDRLTMYVVGPDTKTMAIYLGKVLLWEKTLSKLEGKFTAGTTTTNMSYKSNSTGGTTVYLAAYTDDDNEFETNTIGVTPFFMNNARLERIDNTGNYGGVTDFFGMFANCTALASADLSNLDVSKVTKVGSMFANCHALTALDLSAWDTASLTSVDSAFSGCIHLNTLDLSGWDTSNVTWLNNMVSGCTALSYINLRGWNFASVTSMSDMFKNCTSLSTVGGSVSGIKADLDLSHCPLTAASAMVIINGLATVTANSRTLKLKSSTYSSLTVAQRKIAATKGWTLVSV